MNNNPLVTICTTFFNAEGYIHRALDSCLNQTYKNVEMVVVDDASTDDSERVIREYMARDSRIKYFRNDKRIGVSESFLQMAECATGDLAMVMGADDWLARDYIENGVRSFLEHPDIAGVVPDLTSLFEYENDVFTFGSRTHFSSKKRSAEWFIKRIYRPNIHLYISGYALVRSKDLVGAMDYYVKNYYHNPSKSVPEELRGFFRRAYGIDSMLFPEILTRYKSFVFDSSLNYIKISHPRSQRFDLGSPSADQRFALGWNSLSEIFKGSYYYLLIYKYIFESKWPKYYPKMKIFLGGKALSAIFIYFFRCGMRPSFLNFRESKIQIRGFFREFSFFEIVMALMYSVLIGASRSFDFLKRKFVKKEKQHKLEESLTFTQKNFLDSGRRFKVS